MDVEQWGMFVTDTQQSRNGELPWIRKSVYVWYVTIGVKILKTVSVMEQRWSENTPFGKAWERIHLSDFPEESDDKRKLKCEEIVLLCRRIFIYYEIIDLVIHVNDFLKKVINQKENDFI